MNTDIFYIVLAFNERCNYITTNMFIHDNVFSKSKLENMLFNLTEFEMLKNIIYNQHRIK